MKYYYTYLLRHKLDGRLYIGSRGCNCLPEEDTAYMSSSKAVTKEYLALCAKRIIRVFKTRIDALEHEIRLHNMFDVAVNPKFFNASKQTSIKFDRTGVPMSDKQKERISKANKISCNRPEVKERYRQAKLGTKVSDATKQKLRELNLGSNSPKAKKVLCIETGVTYGSVSEAGIAVGVHYSGIVKACTGKQKTAKNFTWKYI